MQAQYGSPSGLICSDSLPYVFKNTCKCLFMLLLSPVLAWPHLKPCACPLQPWSWSIALAQPGSESSAMELVYSVSTTRVRIFHPCLSPSLLRPPNIPYTTSKWQQLCICRTITEGMPVCLPVCLHLHNGKTVRGPAELVQPQHSG